MKQLQLSSIWYDGYNRKEKLWIEIGWGIVLIALLFSPIFAMGQASGGQIRRTNKSNSQSVKSSNAKPSKQVQQSRVEIPLYKVISERDKTCELVATETDACISRMTKGKYVIPSEIKGYTVVSIGARAFYGCDIESITLPNSIVYIGDGAFQHCTSLKSISLPNQIERTGDKLFMDCESLMDVVLPSNLKLISAYCFMGCKSLHHVSIPDGVSSIGNSAFDQCILLTSILIPPSVKVINKYAFYGCSNLRSVTLHSNDCSIKDKCFKNIYRNAILYLVNAKESVYVNAGMNQFFSKIIEK